MEAVQKKSGFEALKYYYDNRDAYAKEWKARGGKVVGYFCNAVPEEMIIAAGFLPYRISGDPTKKPIKLPRAYVPFDAGLASMLSMVLTGDYDFLDYLIVPRSKSSIITAFAVLRDTKAMDPDAPFPEPYAFVRTQTTFDSSMDFNRESFSMLKAKLEEWAGKEITDDALRDAIKVCNETRALLKKLEACRADESLPVSGTDALRMIAPAMFMDKAEYNKLLAETLADLPKNGGGKVRVFVSGGPKDNTQLYEAIESCGATVVGEDHCWGNRYSEDPVDESDPDPMHAIFHRYIFLKGCPNVYPMQSRIDTSAKFAARAKPQAAVFSTYEEDSMGWDIPGEIKAVEEQGVKTVYLMAQPYVVDAEAVKKTVSELIADCQ